jgi:hypothetical protein
MGSTDASLVLYCKEVPNYQHRISRGSLSHTFDGFVANGVREVAAGESENLLARFDLSIAPKTIDTDGNLAGESGAPRDSAFHSFMSPLLGWMWVRAVAWFKEEKLPVGRQVVSERWNLKCLSPSAGAQEEMCVEDWCDWDHSGGEDLI